MSMAWVELLRRVQRQVMINKQRKPAAYTLDIDFIYSELTLPVYNKLLFASSRYQGFSQYVGIITISSIVLPVHIPHTALGISDFSLVHKSDSKCYDVTKNSNERRCQDK